MVTKANNLEKLIGTLKKRDISTGDFSVILQFSQQHIVKLCYEGLLEYYTIGRRSRRIQVRALVDFVKKHYSNLETQYPQQQLLHFMEVVGLDPKLYGLKGLAGKDGLRFHTQQALYRSGEFANLIKVATQTIDCCFDEGKIEGYKLPNSDHRRILASAVARHVKDNKITLEENVQIATSPGIITFPDPYLGYGRDTGEWLKGSKVADNISEKQSVWYRYNDGVHEVSIRQNNDYGLYVRLAEIEGGSLRIDLILLDKANQNSDGGLLPIDEHLNRVYELLKIGVGLSIDQCYIALNRLLEVYPELKERNPSYPRYNHKPAIHY